MFTPLSREILPMGRCSAREAVIARNGKALILAVLQDASCGHDDQTRKSHGESAARPRSDGSGWSPRSARGFILLPLAACPIRPRRERGVDWQSHATCAVSAFLHCGDHCLPRLRVLAHLPLIKGGVC